MIEVRLARDDDAPAIAEIFRATYGKAYAYPEFYDLTELKRLIFAEDTVLVVAEDMETGEVLGTASVLEEKGAYTDLVAEFGRLAVHPEARRRGIGRLLMQGRLDRVTDRLHIGVAEARVVHPFSTRIAAAHGFAAVGYLPMKLDVAFRENAALMVRHFGDAIELRRNHPRIIPEAYRLAHLAMDNCSLRPDMIVDEEAAPYPYRDDYDLEELTTEGYASLLRIQRGRLTNREIFGPMRLHYGYFKLKAKNSHYLIARNRGSLAGAIGFTHDEREQVVVIFELISLQDEAIRFLLSELLRKCEGDPDVKYIEVDASAYAPRMQRTLLELGFLPVAYVPALVFHDVERLDVVKMARLFTPIDTSHDVLIPEVKPIAELVLRRFERRTVEPRIRSALDRIAIFAGLNEEQQRRLATRCELRHFDEGSRIFEEGSDGDEIHLLLRGEVAVYLRDHPEPIGTVGEGECLGEVSALSGVAHSATAVARTDVESAVLSREALGQLIRSRPDIGVALFRNLAVGLGRKLQRSDLELLQR